MKTAKPTYAQLQRRVAELESSQLSALFLADRNIHKASTSVLMGSGVILHLTGIDGVNIISPVMVRDGLSPETITALRKDFARCCDVALAYKL